MTLRLLICTLVGGSLLLGATTAFGESVRYFEVWSYTENAPRNEIPADRLSGRKRGYWALAFDAEGQVQQGAYHSETGYRWFHLRYVEVESKIYADLYRTDGSFQARKSTMLHDLKPRWRDGAAGREK